ncbi:MAG: hypothetical protein WCO26_17515 [Deltaproteobacteria bacterium]
MRPPWDWDKEMGSIVDLLCRKKTEEAPTLLFDGISGYPSGYQCFYHMFNSPVCLALTLGMPTSGYRGGGQFKPDERLEWEPLVSISLALLL